MTDKEVIEGMRKVINQHSATIKQLADMVNKQSKQISSLQSVVVKLNNLSEMKGEGERLDNFHKMFAEALKGKK